MTSFFSKSLFNRRAARESRRAFRGMNLPLSLPAMTSVSDLMPTSIVETSRASGWRSVEVMKAKIFADELEVKDLTTHTIAVNVGDAYHLRGIVDAASVQAMMYPGMLKVVPSGPASRWNWTSKAPLNILHISVPEESVRTLLVETELSQTEILTRVGVMDGRVAALSGSLAMQVARTASDGRLAAESLAQEIIVHLVRNFSSRGELLFLEPRGRLTPREMSAVESFIEANLDKSISLEQLAQVTGKSRFHFGRLFRRSVGTAPYRYVMERRITRAFGLLRHSGLPVYARSGGRSGGHMSRQRIAVVGGTAGIGAGLARAAAARGLDVVVLGRNASAELPPVVRFEPIDIADESSISAAFDRLGPVDYLATPAAFVSPTSFKGGSTSNARRTMDGKFWSQYLCVNYAVVSESILLFSGVLSRRPSAGTAALAATNAAVEALGRALAVELAPVRVNTLSPGLVAGTNAYVRMPEAAREAMFAASASRLPTGTVSGPDAVAELALAVLVNSYTTGTVVDVDGGALLV